MASCVIVYVCCIVRCHVPRDSSSFHAAPGGHVCSGLKPVTLIDATWHDRVITRRLGCCVFSLADKVRDFVDLAGRNVCVSGLPPGWGRVRGVPPASRLHRAIARVETSSGRPSHWNIP